MKQYIRIYGASLSAKRLIESFWWNDSEYFCTKCSNSTQDNPRYNISIIGGYKLEVRDDDPRLRLAPIKTNLGLAALDASMYDSAVIGFERGYYEYD